MSMEFHREYLGAWPRPTTAELRLEALVLQYYEKTDRYNQLVKGQPDAFTLGCRFARETAECLKIEAARLGCTSKDWQEAKERVSRMSDEAQAHRRKILPEIIAERELQQPRD